MNKYKIMVTTHPFGSVNDLPIKMLHGHEVYLNDVGRKYSPKELLERLVKFNPDIIIAGTEKYTSDTLDLLPDLKMISRVGIGLDSVPLNECRRRAIVVSYTPDAPSNAVAELAVGQMIKSATSLVARSINRLAGRPCSRSLPGPHSSLR